MSDSTRIVTPDAPRDLKPLHPAAERTLRALVRWTDRNARAERDAGIREKAVRDFATFLATTASPSGTVQREKLQGFATEFLNRAGDDQNG